MAKGHGTFLLWRTYKLALASHLALVTRVSISLSHMLSFAVQLGTGFGFFPCPGCVEEAAAALLSGFRCSWGAVAHILT